VVNNHFFNKKYLLESQSFFQIYYNINNNNSKEVKDKNIENVSKIDDKFNTSNKYDFANNNHNTYINDDNNKFNNAYENLNNNLNENLLLNSNNSNTYEFHSNTLSQFSFRK
jgi:hypothetical protein